MKKRSGLLIGILALCMLLCACGSGEGGTSSASDPAGIPNAVTDAAAQGNNMGGLSVEAESEEAEGSRVYADENAKIIRTAYLDIQTTSFQTAYQALNTLVNHLGGYFESAEISGGGYYDQDGAQYGSFVVRVPKNQYDALLQSAGEIGYVVTVSQSSQDVGAEYFDTETRLKTQRTKQARLQTLLEQAATMEDIIALENALAEVEYQIEQYTSDLRRYDALVDYATIRIALSEVRRISGETKVKAGLGERLVSAFTSGIANFGEGLGDFLVWFAYHLIGILITLAILAAVVALAVQVHKKNRAYAAALRAPSRGRPVQKPEASQSDQKEDTPDQEEK